MELIFVSIAFGGTAIKLAPQSENYRVYSSPKWEYTTMAFIPKREGVVVMTNILVAKERAEFRRSYLNQLKAAGELPAVVYGNEQNSTPISVSNAEFQRLIKEVGRNGIINLQLTGQTHNVMLTDYQRDPLKNEIYHADFLIVNMDAEMNAQVRVILDGESAGEKDGGVLQQSMHEVAVTARPKDIPEVIDIDVTNMHIGDVVTIGDIRSKFTVALNHEDEEVVASILAPRLETDPEPAEPSNDEPQSDSDADSSEA
ncbi:50S ribosomal protein L25/general stress protein Ctc [Peribacillus sp. SCS-155]|uniref:50S ribosomal protein L25/general stress protein Ctc n=1 Tax=Peribacillus sedimenti TaxID=3115297 RepID=UPI003905BCF6